VTDDELVRICLEVVAGLRWGDPRSQVPQTDEHRASWERIAEQVEALMAEGITIDLPRT
jgi:hypothetical protein